MVAFAMSINVAVLCAATLKRWAKAQWGSFPRTQFLIGDIARYRRFRVSNSAQTSRLSVPILLPAPRYGRLPMDQFEFVFSPNIKRYQNLLETSVDETERRTIQKLLTEEEAKQPKHNPSSRCSGG